VPLCEYMASGDMKDSGLVTWDDMLEGAKEIDMAKEREEMLNCKR
jgi:hypothetical protein